MKRRRKRVPASGRFQVATSIPALSTENVKLIDRQAEHALDDTSSRCLQTARFGVDEILTSSQLNLSEGQGRFAEHHSKKHRREPLNSRKPLVVFRA